MGIDKPRLTEEPSDMLKELLKTFAAPRSRNDNDYGYCCPELSARLDRRMAENFTAEERIDLETKHLVPTLLRLHDLGLFTTQSQPYGDQGPEYTQCDCCPDWAWFHSMQRPFLTFLVPQKDTLVSDDARSKMIAELMRDERIFTGVFNGEKGFDNFPKCSNPDCPDLEQYQGLLWETNFTKKAPKRELLEAPETLVKGRAYVHPRDYKIVNGFMEKTGNVLSANPLVVGVIARKWEDVNVPDVVLEAAVKAGMKPVYAK